MPPSVRAVLRSSGELLDEATRALMEQRFGHDFSRVRIHADSLAAQSARAVNARAYTVSRHIVFDSAEYAPRTTGGRRLLAHELTHVVQQEGFHGDAASAAITMGRTDTAHEHEASDIADGRRQVGSTPLIRGPLMLQRQPAQQGLRDSLCFRAGSRPVSQGDCSAPEPENCPSYEQWLNSLGSLRTFDARDTAPGGNDTTGFHVLGERAIRPVDAQDASPDSQAAPAIRPQAGDRFIDHPTDRWVRTCLPENLRETAYILPSDCADIAVILRHVWLSAHHRTESYGRWTVGDGAGRARQRDVDRIIGQVYSGNVARMVNAYSDARGAPLRAFQSHAQVGADGQVQVIPGLEDLLHPGDVLVWEHHSGGLGTARTGGHTQTIVSIERENGRITRIHVVQGNQPIFPPSDAERASGLPGQTGEIRDYARQHRPRDVPSESSLRNAPGRRVETNALTDASLRDLELPPPRGRPDAESHQWAWTWGDGNTTLVAAGPPAAARRPATRSIGGQRLRRISDWVGSLQRATSSTLQGTLEAALLELRAMIEGSQTVPDADATLLGQAAGLRLWTLARHAGGLGEEEHFRPLQQGRSLIRALGDPSGESGYSSAATPRATEVRRVFRLLDRAFERAARGASDISFGRRVPRGDSLIRILVTGFDPFAGTGPVTPGTVNPSGAAALALDGSSIEAERHVTAAVEGMVLPVSFAEFRAGLVESIVQPLVQSRQVDAVLTVSLDESIGPAEPVRLERFVVGVHRDRRLEPVAAAPGGMPGPAIIETPAPLEAIAADTARPARGRTAAIPTPTVGTGIQFVFSTASIADQAMQLLGLRPIGRAEVNIADIHALQQIIRTMWRASNGTEIAFLAGGRRFQATVLAGPGGDFLSNEVSYRVLRMLGEQQRLDVTSFHVHVPRVLPTSGEQIPQDTSTRAARTERRRALDFARDAVARLVATLRRLIAAVARRIAARQSSASGSQGGGP